jgi:hypothetical protein
VVPEAAWAVFAVDMELMPPKAAAAIPAINAARIGTTLLKLRMDPLIVG